MQTPITQQRLQACCKAFIISFYASFDPAGFITVDKPPVVFWVQTAFAAVFGVHGWSVIFAAGFGRRGLSTAYVYTRETDVWQDGCTAFELSYGIYASCGGGEPYK
ncbi:hypothetical protein GCM10020331_043360 [Ectobacillus funiculus]